jgi:quercetin dioxygenase-like cupin family protein
MEDRMSVVEPGQGRSVSLRGTNVTFKVTSGEAAGASVVEFDTAPGFDTGTHVHTALEETFYVVEGELEFELAGELTRASAGATIFVPPHVPHRFGNRGQTRARTLLVMSPPGHDRYFDELAAILATDGPPDAKAIADLRHRYDTEQMTTLAAL